MIVSVDRPHAVADPAVVLLVDQHKGSLLPLNQRGLEHTQKSRRRLKADYPDAAILLPCGAVLPIADFLLGSPIGPGLPWPFEWLTLGGERHLTLVFGEAKTPPLEETRRMILDCLNRETHRDEWLLDDDSWDRLMLRVQQADSSGALFEALHLTSPEDGLDVFS
jgi:hypothetical protein